MTPNLDSALRHLEEQQRNSLDSEGVLLFPENVERAMLGEGMQAY